MSDRPSAIEIDRKIRDDFRRRLKDYGISAETVDPVLAVLFRTFAHRLETLYDETGRIRLALLDELIKGLAFAPRMARPAQTIIRMLSSDRHPQVIPAGTELHATAHGGEKLSFSTDAAVNVSAAQIALAFTYQDKQLQLLPSVEMPEPLQASRPSLDSVPCDLGPEPALFLAFDDLPESHLGGHSLFFELGLDSFQIQRALWTEPWCLVGNDGELSAKGVLRPQRGNAGVQSLWFLVQQDAARALPQNSMPAEAGSSELAASSTAILPDGFYAGRVFVFPAIPEDRRFRCSVPRGMETAIRSIFGAHAGQAFAERRGWVRISMPRLVPRLQLTVNTIYLHAVSASNVECVNQTVQFARQGLSIPISHEAGNERFLVAPLSIFGEAGHTYIGEFSPSSNPDVGRFGVRHGRIHLEPARHPDGRPDEYVNMRVWSTQGQLGNSVGPGRIAGFSKSTELPGVRLLHPVSAAGGTNGESYEDAHGRFASLLLARNKIVTEADLLRAAYAFDRRIVKAEVQPSLQRTPQGLQRVEKIIATAEKTAFVDPEIELSMLQEDLVGYLRERVLHGTEVSVEVLAA